MTTKVRSPKSEVRSEDMGRTPTAQLASRCGSTSAGRSVAGFTLIEVMIAITILTLIVAAIYSSWTAILRSSKVGRDVAASVQRSRIVLRVLEDSLSSAQSFVANQPFYGFVAENGSQPSLSFVARLAKSFPRSGRFGDLDVRRVTFSLENEQLVLRQVPLVMEADEDEVNHPIVLAKHVKEFSMEFWDNRLNDWVDEWKQTNQLPRLVSFTLRLADNERAGQPQQEIYRIINIPSVAVQPVWQAPRVPPGGLPPGTVPGTQPGSVPGGVPPGGVPPGAYPGQQPGIVPSQPGTFTSPGRITPR